MIFDFYLRKLDIDAEAARRLYSVSDYATGPYVCARFARGLTGGQKKFFDALGVNPSRIAAEERIYKIL